VETALYPNVHKVTPLEENVAVAAADEMEVRVTVAPVVGSVPTELVRVRVLQVQSVPVYPETN
jgi:hypothetical protein